MHTCFGMHSDNSHHNDATLVVTMVTVSNVAQIRHCYYGSMAGMQLQH